MSQTAPRYQRNFGLDVLRTVAITVVLLNHGYLGFFVANGLSKWEGWNAAISACAVFSIEWLFVLSGFLIGSMMIRSFETRGGWVGLSAARAGPGELVLHVADRGPGVPEGDLERIFQPFFSRRAGGTGLGLSIVQRIVSAIGGRIEVASGPKGSDFSLVFPEAEP